MLATDLVISEFVASNVSTLADEDNAFSDWIEIRNTTTDPIDLANWSLTDDSLDLDKWKFPSQSLPAGGHLVVFASGKDRATAGSELHTNFKLDAGGEYLALVRPDGVTVQDVFAPTYPNQFADISYGVSGDLSTRGYFTTPSPGTPNAGTPIADPTRQVIISEIMYHPASENDAQEFIELYNKGLVSVNLSGWKFSAGVSFTFPNVNLGVGQRLVVAASLSAFQGKYPGVANVVGSWTGTLSNSGESIALEDAAGKTIDRVAYADEGDWGSRGADPVDGGWTWLSTHDGGGRSLELVNSRLTNNSGQNWRASTAVEGTPGAANSVAQTDSAPLIDGLEQSPIIPQSFEPVTIAVDLMDEQSTGLTAAVFYRISGATNFDSAPMFDDGLHGDGRAADGRYAGVLPGRPDHTIVEFYVQATDAANNSRTWPAPAPGYGQATNALYQVDATFNPTAPWDPNSQPTYRLIMTTADYTAFAGQQRTSNQQRNATFVSIDGTGVEVRHLIGVRFRGNSSRTFNPPPLRVEFPEDNRFNGDDNMNLNTRGAWLQLAGATVFRLAGMAAAEAVPVHVTLNNVSGGPWGAPPNDVYVRLDPLDADFANQQFPDDSNGNMYKKVRANAPDTDDWVFHNGDVPGYESDGWSKSTNASENDWSDLDHFTDAIDNTPAGPGYFQTISQVVNVDQWVRWFAVMQLLNSRETSISNGTDDDYQMYRGVIDPRFALLPHDLDTIFGQGDTPSQPTTGIFQPYDNVLRVGYVIPQLETFFNDPEVVRRYYAAIRELIATVFAPERLNPMLDEALADHVPAATISAMKTFAAARCAHVLSLIPSSFTADSGLPVVNGYPHSTIAAIGFIGTADAATVQSVVAGGQLATWNAFSGTWTLGTTGQPTTETLINAGAQWRYRDTGDQGTAWRAAGFNDSAWPLGNAEFGFGDGGEATVVSNLRTTYYRRAFTVQNAAGIESLTVNLQRDDGAVVYLNGVELFRDNMPQGTVSFTTRASTNVLGGDESTFFPTTVTIVSLPPGTLLEGTNVLAVELHQRAFGTDSDASFNLSLVATRPAVAGGVTLAPGINRILVQAFNAAGGTGQEVSRVWQDIWYDDGNMTTVSANLPAGTTTWTAANGPYNVTADVTVPTGATLIIDPGTTVFFNANTGLTVNGTLQAVGTPAQRIRFTRLPSAAGNWDGIRILNSGGDNRLAYFDQAYGDVNTRSIQASNSTVSIDHGEWFNTTRQILDFNNSTWSLTNSTLPNIQSAEIVHMSGMPAGGSVLVQGNTFGRTTGFNDVMDLTGGNRPGPIVQILDNVFLGGEDDILDLDGTDAHIEGNVFMAAHLAAANVDTSSAISGGADSGNTSELTIVRNYFYNLDHVLLVKEGNSAVLVNNTMHHITVAAINFEEPGNGTAGPGLGATLDGNIIWDTPVVFQNTNLSGTTTQITINRTITPQAVPYAGIGNLVADPKFVTTTGITDPRTDLRLRPVSPATGAGFNGVDMGAAIPGGATISGEPPANTHLNSATLDVGGKDILAYKYRVNGGPWSTEVSAGTPIQLSGLADGSYTVDVVAKNSAGFWQPDAQATHSKSWTVNSSLVSLLINEVLASNVAAHNNGGTFPDVIELLNAGAGAIDLAGMSISDDPANPAKFVFPAGTTMASGQTLLVYGDPASAAPGIHLGFSLDGEGEGVYLYNSPGAGGTLVDSVAFGPQVDDFSIGRVGHDRHWALNVPTPGAANVEQFTGDVYTLKINEWFTNGNVRFREDFLEIYNPDVYPVHLGGLYISDDSAANADQHRIGDLSYAPAHGSARFVADDVAQAGGNHLPFQLSSDMELLGLFDSTLRRIDELVYFSQTTDFSQGRNPDGSSATGFFTLPTPGLSNPPVAGVSTEDLVTLGSTWKYLDDNSDQGTAWRQPGFNDTSWASGQAELGYGDGDERTVVQSGPTGGRFITTYFRHTFTVNDFATIRALSLALKYDDGGAVYINGVEVARTSNLPGTLGDNSVTSSTFADFNGAVATENQIGGFNLPQALIATLLHNGENVLAVEIHQHDLNSSDISFDLALQATRDVPPPPVLEPALNLFAGLRITEIMYNPAGAGDDEYIELANVGGAVLDLTGVRISDGIDYTFPAKTLAPGEMAVIVQNLSAFRAKYGSTIPVAGQYTGNLSNAGEDLTLKLAAPYDAGILRFDYEDDWYPTTDGIGRSLVVVDVEAPAGNWDQKSNWQASAAVGGSPGRSETAPPPIVLSIDTLQTSDTTPPLSGTVNYPATQVSVTVAGNTYAATNHGDGAWSLADNVIAPPLAPGVYDVVVSAQDGLGIVGTDVTSNELTIQVPPNATVAGRRIFYNNSKFDGNNAAALPTDDGAVAPDKTALLPGGSASFVNYTNFSKGINGIMVDVANLPPSGAVSPADFVFRVGNSNTPATWIDAPPPASVTVRAGAGSLGSSRISITWLDGAIKKQWLQVTVLATVATGLAAPDVFYFGNAIGEAGNSATDFQVNAGDELAARANPRNLGNPAPIDFRFDYNRDGQVNAADQLLSRANSTNLASALKVIVPGTTPGGPNPPPLAAAAAMFADQADDDLTPLRKKRPA